MLIVVLVSHLCDQCRVRTRQLLQIHWLQVHRQCYPEQSNQWVYSIAQWLQSGWKSGESWIRAWKRREVMGP